MTDSTTTTDSTAAGTNWSVSYDVEPLRVRDPVAETLGVLAPGDPFVVGYRDVVAAAGHSCPTAAGAFRIAAAGLDALYPDALPVRGEVRVHVGGPRDETRPGVTGRLLSSVTGAAEEDGFAGLAGGFGDRRDLLSFGAVDRDDSRGADDGADDLTVAFRREDDGRSVDVTYRVGDLPRLGPAREHLPAVVDGTAGDEERRTFRTAWHDRVRTVLHSEDLFVVEAPSRVL